MQKIIFGLSLLILLGCGESIQYAGGKEDEVFVVSDPATWKDVEELVRNSVEKEIRIVHWEQIFFSKRVDPDEFPRYRGRKNLLLVGRITGQRTSKLIQELLPTSSVEKVIEKGMGIFVVENPYREGQIAMVIAGMNEEQIRQILQKSQDVIFQTLWDKAKERIKARVFSDLNTRLIENLKKKYGWVLKLPTQYKITKEEENMVRFARHYPDRLISIYWFEQPMGELNPKECLEKREWFGRVYYDGDTILPDMTEVSDVELNGMRATRIDGVWQNEKYVMGGAFITLCIHQSGPGRNYLIDGLLFSPGRKKWIYLAELEGIIESFRFE